MSRMSRSVRSPDGGQLLGEVAQPQLPRGVVASEELGDVASCHVGELLAALVGQHPTVWSDGPQQGAGQGAGADPRLDDVGAGEHVGHGDDLRGVLGVDDGRATWHRHDELREQRPEDEVLTAQRTR